MTGTEGYLPIGDGLRLFFCKIGDGAPTLVVPNGLYLLDDFARLSERRTILFYDVRNRGKSDTVTDRAKLARGIEQDVDDLDAVRRHFGVERIDVLGHSYIGMMVALYAMRYPAHVNRVVQIGPIQAEALKQYPAHFSNNDATLADVMLQLERFQKDRPADPQEACRKFWTILRFIYVTDARDADRVNFGRCELENERMFMRYWIGELLPSIRAVVLRPDDYAKAQAPVLTIHGTKDRSAPYGGGRDWAAALPNARLVTVPNAGHAPWIEAPDLVFEAITSFLEGAWPRDAQRASPVPNHR
jgi:proline iminopeptidase